MTNDTIELLKRFQRVVDFLPSRNSGGYEDLDVQGIIDDLASAVRDLDNLSSDLRGARDALREFATTYNDLAANTEDLLPDAIDLAPNQYWRLEPYPWPGADPEPLIRL
jgi:ABC-type transporter Mla subunit MlaD